MSATKNDIQLLRITYLRGPNIWTYRPCLEVWLDLGELEEHPSNQLPGLNERLTQWLPNLIEHHCGVGESGAASCSACRKAPGWAMCSSMW
jgi:cyanophycin synthetase